MMAALASAVGPHPRNGQGPDPWRALLAGRWGRQPGFVEGGGAALQATPDGVFNALVAASDQLRDGDGAVALRFYVEQALQQADPRDWLPSPRDRSVDGYVARMTRALGGRRFCLVLNHLQVFDPALWLRLRELMGGLRDRLGLAAGSVDLAAFIGTYRCTPFGVHRDQADTMAVVVAGRKRFRFWPGPRFAAGGPIQNSVRYGHVLGSATTVHAGPGDLVYWPASAWHIAESTPPYSISLSIPVLHADGGRADVYGNLVQHLHDSLLATGGGRTTVPVRGHGASRAARAGSLVTSVRRTLRRAASEPQLAGRMRAALLRAVSAGGFLAVPPPAPRVALRDEWVLRGDPRHPVVWTRAGRRRLLCGANGHAFETAGQGIARLLARLNRGEPVAARGARGAARAVLERLLSLRAIARVELASTGRDRRPLPCTR